MPLNFRLHHYIEPGNEILTLLRAMSRKQDLDHRILEQIMLDTSKMLAAVADERTELAGWKALVAANTTAMKDLSTQLAAAIAANDPAALAQVQADLDKAAADLSADNADAAAAIAANTPAPAP